MKKTIQDKTQTVNAKARTSLFQKATLGVAILALLVASYAAWGTIVIGHAQMNATYQRGVNAANIEQLYKCVREGKTDCQPTHRFDNLDDQPCESWGFGPFTFKCDND